MHIDLTYLLGLSFASIKLSDIFFWIYNFFKKHIFKKSPNNPWAVLHRVRIRYAVSHMYGTTEVFLSSGQAHSYLPGKYPTEHQFRKCELDTTMIFISDLRITRSRGDRLCTSCKLPGERCWGLLLGRKQRRRRGGGRSGGDLRVELMGCMCFNPESVFYWI